MRQISGFLKGIIRKILRIVKMPFFNVHQRYFRFAGSTVECNICHYKANRLNSDSWHLYCTCPYCNSGVRQRLLMASLLSPGTFNFDIIIRNKKILHFAPEYTLGKILKGMATEYKTADFLADGYSYDTIDYNIDISNMNIIESESFDCVIACDVLEHVPDDSAGIREVHRILRNGGYCIFTVPQKDNLKVTFEDRSITGKKERERAFGQADHLRIYGDDFVTLLQDCGFDVTAVDESFFDKSMADRHVLFPPVLSNHPLATNYRKIFFGRKL